MKKFGLIGGTSWRSSMEYYSNINQAINDRFGDNTNPPLRMVNLNQKEIHDLQRLNDWDAITRMYISASLELQNIDVEGLALCANTPHKVFENLESALSIPVLHIADAIGTTLVQSGFNSVGLIGTRFTMEESSSFE